MGPPSEATGQRSTKINFIQTFFNDVPNPNGGKKKLRKNIQKMEDIISTFLKVMLSLQQNSDKQYVAKFLLRPTSDLRRKKGHQIVASMGLNAGKIKASNVEIKMQMPLQSP